MCTVHTNNDNDDDNDDDNNNLPPPPHRDSRHGACWMQSVQFVNLQRCDRMTMAHSLEARVPFFDVNNLASAPTCTNLPPSPFPLPPSACPASTCAASTNSCKHVRRVDELCTRTDCGDGVGGVEAREPWCRVFTR